MASSSKADTAKAVRGVYQIARLHEAIDDVTMPFIGKHLSATGGDVKQVPHLHIRARSQYNATLRHCMRVESINQPHDHLQ
jgi:hypothetical protein